MRTWWQQNKAAFQAGDYKAVHPPNPEPPPSPPSLPNPAEAKRVWTPNTPAPPPKAVVETISPAPSTPVAVVRKVIEAKSDSRSVYVWGFLVILLTIAGGWLFARKQKRK